MFGNSAFPKSTATPKKPGMGSMSSMTPATAGGGLAAKIAQCEQKISDLEQRVSALEQGEQGENEQGEADSTPGGDSSAY